MHVIALLEACKNTLYLSCPYMMHNRSAQHIQTVRKLDAWQFIWGGTAAFREHANCVNVACACVGVNYRAMQKVVLSFSMCMT